MIGRSRETRWEIRQGGTAEGGGCGGGRETRHYDRRGRHGRGSYSNVRHCHGLGINQLLAAERLFAVLSSSSPFVFVSESFTKIFLLETAE